MLPNEEAHFFVCSYKETEFWVECLFISDFPENHYFFHLSDYFQCYYFQICFSLNFGLRILWCSLWIYKNRRTSPFLLFTQTSGVDKDWCWFKKGESLEYRTRALIKMLTSLSSVLGLTLFLFCTPCSPCRAI